MHSFRFIAGSGRSGTTWVQDALAEANGMRPVFEPLHPAISEVGRRYAYRALSTDEHHPDLEQFLHEVCAGKRNRWWTQYRRRGDRLFPPLARLMTVQSIRSEYRSWRKFWSERPSLAEAARRTEPLIKCIRANLMLGWLSRRCNGRVVLIVRHPGAVVESQFRLGHGPVWDPEPVLGRYRIDKRLHELTEERYCGLLARRLSRIQALTLNWVIENQLATEQAAVNNVTVVFYERLKASPVSEWTRLCRALELPNLPPTAILARPSQQSSRRYAGGSMSVDEVSRWQSRLTSEQIREIQGVLDAAGFTSYETGKLEPVVAPCQDVDMCTKVIS